MNEFIVDIGRESNVRSWIAGKTAGMQRSPGAHQQRVKLVSRKEKIILSKVYASIDYFCLFIFYFTC